VNGRVEVGVLLPLCCELEAERSFLFLAERQHRDPATPLETGPFTTKSLTYRPIDLHWLFHGRAGLVDTT
jgi:hypothetical protein